MIETKDDKEKTILRQFQEKVADLNQDETTCLRFLIAREFNVEKAEEMIRHSINWRKEVQIDKYSLWTVPGTPREDFPFEVTGISNNGGPVIWVPLGRWLARYWVERGKKDDVEHFGYHILETALRRMQELNKGQVVAMLCMKNLSIHTVRNMDCLKTLYAAFSALEKNYPELLQTLFVMEAPWVFSIAFNFIKPILSQRTLNKIKIFGSDKQKYLPVLQELVPDDAIPNEYFT